MKRLSINRDFFNSDIWKAEREFSLAEAWIDLLQRAWPGPDYTTVYDDERCFSVAAGECIISDKVLSEAWHIPIGKVESYLKCFESRNMIAFNSLDPIFEDSTDPICYDIEILEYDEVFNANYGRSLITTCLSKDELNDFVSQIAYEVAENIKRKKKPQKTNNDLTGIETRKENFAKSLVPYVETYGKYMIKQFYEYWTETNKSKTKMRFEQQPTWETAKRLVTWARRSEGYGNRQINGTASTHEQRRDEAAELVSEFISKGHS